MLKSKDFMELEKLVDNALNAARMCGKVQENGSSDQWQKALAEAVAAERALWSKFYEMRGNNALAACAVDPRG